MQLVLVLVPLSAYSNSLPRLLGICRVTHLVSRDKFILLCSDWLRDDEGGVLSRLLGKDLFDGTVAGNLLSIDGTVEEHGDERAVWKIKLAVLLQDALRTSQCRDRLGKCPLSA